uniref:Uncharacterized protein n=1 Tax=Rhizochromulina marina TaxID=1034831 RepID=A0A7S2RZ89_9STRA
MAALARAQAAAAGGPAPATPAPGLMSELERRKQDIAAKLASVSSVLANSSALLQGKAKRPTVKAQDFTLRLDAQGRAIDERGNVLKESGPVRTLKANVQRTLVNPYLPEAPSKEGEPEEEGPTYTDMRIRIKDRAQRAKKAFQFHQEGVFVKQDDLLQAREQKKMQAGFSSGRNQNAYVKVGMSDLPIEPEVVPGGDAVNKASQLLDSEALPQLPEEASPVAPKPAASLVGQTQSVPHSVEWWDVAFLPSDKRKDAAAAYDLAKLTNSKFHALVVHPAPTKPLGYDEKGPQLPVFLTKKERKRIRRQAREERRNEMLDKIALGLMPAPEPKLKLANFMKVLGDQAVADPSKIEKKVMEQVQQRVMNHEMRNMAQKLTPQERKDKKRRKLTEDTSRQVVVAVYRVKDLSNQQHQFKVDMNAQQNSLTGGVLTCKGDVIQGEPNLSLVVVEGGPKAIKRYSRLMLRRIQWTEEGEDEDDGDGDGGYGAGEAGRTRNNRCDLVWTGTVVRRSFNAFRFQECKSGAAARKVMESKGVAHYWDMVLRGDTLDANDHI